MGTDHDPDPAEFIERAALADLQAAAPPELVTKLGLACVETGGAYVSVAGGLPASAIVANRVIGLGYPEPADRNLVQQIARTYRDAGVDRYFVHVHPNAAPEALTGWLGEAGWERTRGWQKFHRGREAVPDRPADLRLEAVGPEHGTAFGAIVAAAFDLGDAAIPWLACLPGRANWHVFMSFDGDEPAGAGALYVKDGFAWTDWGATAPAFRRRGGQGAVLAARVRCALDLGVERVFTCTGEDVPGDPQHSFNNILRLGFARGAVRANYAPPK